MGKKLAGTLLIRQGVVLDYCFEAAIRSLQACCDWVFIVEAGSADNTYEVLQTLQDGKTTIIKCSQEQWDEQKGREKLSYFSNIAIDCAQRSGYEYQFNLQGDEVLHEDSFPFIKEAVELGEEGYIVTRHNLWGSPYTMLNVPQSRKPVSTQVTRLTKTNYRSVGDAESVNCPASLDFINKIEIFHMGFVRDSKKHVEKIKEIQGNIFLMDVDSRVKDAETFDAWGMGFDKTDVIPVHKPLPEYIQEWIKDKL